MTQAERDLVESVIWWRDQQGLRRQGVVYLDEPHGLATAIDRVRRERSNEAEVEENFSLLKAIAEGLAAEGRS